jgi:MFS family permease
VTWAAATGVGLALVFPACQALVADIFEPEKRGRAFGALLTIAALTGMAGSFFSINLGGEHFGRLPVRARAWQDECCNMHRVCGRGWSSVRG